MVRGRFEVRATIEEYQAMKNAVIRVREHKSSLVLNVMSWNSLHFYQRSPKCVENKLRSLVIRARVTDSFARDMYASGRSKRARRRVL